MRLVLDAGNSSTKFGLFDNNQLIQSGIISKDASILSILSNDIINQIECITSCKVTNSISIQDLPAVNHLQIDSKSIFPFANQYQSVQTLGIDRIVACAGAYQKGQNILVIDCGTCITFDMLSAEKGYLGGAISPGIHLRFKAMNNFTDQLPLITRFEEKNDLIGTDTETCLKSGVINGIQAELEGIIHKYEMLYENLIVFLTGGDSIYFEEGLKNSIFADQNLVLKGLDFLTDLNEK